MKNEDFRINIPTIARAIDEQARAQNRPIAQLQALRAALIPLYERVTFGHE